MAKWVDGDPCEVFTDRLGSAAARFARFYPHLLAPELISVEIARTHNVPNSSIEPRVKRMSVPLTWAVLGTDG